MLIHGDTKINYDIIIENYNLPLFNNKIAVDGKKYNDYDNINDINDFIYCQLGWYVYYKFDAEDNRFTTKYWGNIENWKKLCSEQFSYPDQNFWFKIIVNYNFINLAKNITDLKIEHDEFNVYILNNYDKVEQFLKANDMIYEKKKIKVFVKGKINKTIKDNVKYFKIDLTDKIDDYTLILENYKFSGVSELTKNIAKCMNYPDYYQLDYYSKINVINEGIDLIEKNVIMPTKPEFKFYITYEYISEDYSTKPFLVYSRNNKIYIYNHSSAYFGLNNNALELIIASSAAPMISKNSMIIAAGREYYYIGGNVYTFDVNEPILKYHSEENDNKTFSYAISENYYYLMGPEHKIIPKSSCKKINNKCDYSDAKEYNYKIIVERY